MGGEKVKLDERALRAAIITGSNMAGEDLVRDIVTAYLGALPDAPAEMPGEEEIAWLLFQRSVYHGYDADTLKRDWMRTEGLHRGNARAIFDLFAPILAEKQKPTVALNHWKARALAAEAALVAERERCAEMPGEQEIL